MHKHALRIFYTKGIRNVFTLLGDRENITNWSAVYFKIFLGFKKV